GVESVARKSEKFRFGDGNSVRGTSLAIEKGHFPEKIAAAKGGHVIVDFSGDSELDAHHPAADQEQFVPAIATRENSFSRLVGALLHAGFESGERFFLAAGKKADVAEFQRGLGRARRHLLAENALFDPQQRVVARFEDLHGALRPDDADLFEVLLDIAAAGDLQREVAENEEGFVFGQGVLDLFEDVGGGHVHTEYAPHIQHDVRARLEFRFERGQEPVRGSKEKAALELENYGAVAILFEHGQFLRQAHPPGKRLVAIGLPADHGTAALFANEQQNGQANPDCGGGDQADGFGYHHDRQDHHEVQDGRARPEQLETVPVEHAEAHHDQDAGQSREGDPGDQPAQKEESDQGEHAFQHSGKTLLPAAGQVDESSARLARARDASDQRRHDVAETLADQLAVGVVPRARERVEDDGGF